MQTQLAVKSPMVRPRLIIAVITKGKGVIMKRLKAACFFTGSVSRIFHFQLLTPEYNFAPNFLRALPASQNIYGHRIFLLKAYLAFLKVSSYRNPGFQASGSV